jgi:chitinase
MNALLKWLTICALTFTTTTLFAQKKTKIIGFYPDYSAAGVSNAQLSKLTYVIYFSIKPPADGNVSDDYVVNSINAQNMIDIVDQGKKVGCGVLLGVGGAAESANFPSVAGNASLRKKFSTSIADFCVRNGLAGVDIDWEFPGAGGAANFTALAKELRTAFSAKGLVMSTNVNAQTESYQAEGLNQFDWVQIMAYDDDWPVGSTPHSTYLSATQHLTRYTNIMGAANKAKIVLGVPFYGKSYAGSLAYSEILKANPGLSPTADNIAGYNFNGTSTLAQKTNYVLDQGNGGIMIWNLVQDATDLRLLNSISKAAIDKGYIVEQQKPIVATRYFYQAIGLGTTLKNENGSLSWQASAPGQYQLSLVSITGSLIKAWPMEKTSGQTPMLWQTDKMKAGTYLYSLQGTSDKIVGRVTVKK